MAINNGFISNNANAGIGQGLAFVLPQSKTEAYAMQLSQQHAADLRAAALAQQKEQQQLQNQYQKDFAATKIPEYWSVAGKPINEAFTKYQNNAANYLATTGKNPFNNPEFTKQYNDTVLLPARQSKEVEQAGAKLIPMIAADHNNRFTEDSKQSVLKWWDTAQKNPSSVFGQPMPQLQGTPSGIQDFYKTIKPVTIKDDNGTVSITVPDKSAMQAQAYENSNDPRWNNVKRSQYGIDTDLGDIGSVYNPQGKRVWYTNPTATGHIADEILDDLTNPRNAEILAKLNITSEDKYAKEKLQTAIAQQNKGYGKLISDAGNYGESIVSKARDVNVDKFYEHEAWRRAHPTSNTNMQTPAQTLIAGNPNSGISGMQQGGVGTGEKFISLAPLAQYGGKKPSIGVDENTGEHVFNFPAQLGGKDAAAIKFNDNLRKDYARKPEKVGKIMGLGGDKVPFDKSQMAKELKSEIVVKRPEQTYRLNPSSPDYLARTAEMAKEQNINLSQLNQIEGKKGGRGQIQQAVKSQEAAKPKASQTYKVKGKEYKADAVANAAKASVTPSKASTIGGKGKVIGGMSAVGKSDIKNKKSASDYGL